MLAVKSEILQDINPNAVKQVLKPIIQAFSEAKWRTIDHCAWQAAALASHPIANCPQREFRVRQTLCIISLIEKISQKHVWHWESYIIWYITCIK